MSNLPPPYVPTITEQKTFLGTGLHAELMSQFLVGIYVGVFMGTINIYGIRGKQNRSYNKFIAASTVLLFLITLTSLILRWRVKNIVFCNHGNTRLSIVFINGTYKLSPPLSLLLDITEMASFILADVALLWRCFHACGGRLTTSFVLLMGLFIVEIALAITALVLSIIILFSKATISKLLIYGEFSNQISGAAYIAIAVTNSMATFLICKTIYTHTTYNRSARKRLSYLVDSLTQSCGLYTAITVMQAIINLKSNTGYYVYNATTLIVAGLSNYSTSLICATSSLIPTIMIARLAAASLRTDSTSTEPTSFVSPPPELKHQSDPEPASTGVVALQLDKTNAAGEEVDQDDSGIVEETRDKRRGGSDEENCV
ncbi:hypothetical protein CPC08DRAFT_824811 [Agrocybe pediades]|nr:hypothetical protein CPC08DRAFT_824811 [Agrocybe pediades]